MTSTRGPVPERSEDRRRKNQPEGGIQKAQRGDGINSVTDPVFDADENWHPLAKRMFNSLKMSGQSKYYEASDWVQAQYICEVMSRSLGATGRAATGMNANLVTAVLSGFSNLLVTEGDRRRLRLELVDNLEVDLDEAASVANIADYQNRLDADGA